MKDEHTTVTPERRQLYEQIATLVAGHDACDVFCALGDNLWQAAAFLSDSPAKAEELLLLTLPDMMRDMRENWDYIVAAKAQGAALDAAGGPGGPH
jgi:hypothetical protein